MDLTKLIMAQLGEGGIDAMAQKIGADPKQTSSALEGVVPTLLGAMSNNAKSNEGASGLLGALDRDHDGSILDDVTGFIGNSDNGPGAGILKHVLGDNKSAVESGLSQKTGLNSGQIGNMLTMVAPLIMGYLGKQKREDSGGGFDLGGIAGMLGNLASTSDKSTGLDLGDVLSVVGGLTGGNSKGGSAGIGGLLGKLFGR
ncbi:MAG: DUF937 domain-containing protein [Bacteroidia bacterium]|nr:DUF937 domain-containing protein [Bacteroidia bacterium]